MVLLRGALGTTISRCLGGTLKAKNYFRNIVVLRPYLPSQDASTQDAELNTVKESECGLGLRDSTMDMEGYAPNVCHPHLSFLTVP